MLALLELRVVVSASPEHSLAGPPFALFSSDLDSQNVLVLDNRTITGFIDWDGLCVGSPQ